MGGRELSSQNGSLPFKTGELEDMHLLRLNKSFVVALPMLALIAAPRELTALKYTCTMLPSSPSNKAPVGL